MPSPQQPQPEKSEPLTEEAFWGDAWTRHIEHYLEAPSRGGYWIETHFPATLSILEIAGGSCRDSLYLARRGRKVTGSDFDQRTLNYLARHHGDTACILQREDAFDLSFEDREVDLSFSNGFWVLFQDDQDICRLIREQARVTRKYLVSFNHNKENAALVKTFAEKATQDPLYGIRFFSREEITALIKKADIPYKSITIKKFGGPANRLLSRRLRTCCPPLFRLLTRIVPALYAFQPWSKVERIACIVELES